MYATPHGWSVDPTMSHKIKNMFENATSVQFNHCILVSGVCVVVNFIGLAPFASGHHILCLSRVPGLLLEEPACLVVLDCLPTTWLE